MQTSNVTIHYVAIGDSYTIGEGVGEEQAWPVILTDHLRREGVAIELVDNLAVSGYTSEDGIEEELPALESLSPDFITIFLGANDVYRGVPQETFRANLGVLLDTALVHVGQADRVMAITIPDFSLSPAARLYPLVSTKEIEEFNTIIEEEAAARSISIADIFPLSQELGRDRSMFVGDGLHPSVKQLKLWEEIIFETVKPLFQGK